MANNPILLRIGVEGFILRIGGYLIKIIIKGLNQLIFVFIHVYSYMVVGEIIIYFKNSIFVFV